MGTKDVPGIAVIIVGVVLAVGAVRGTWKSIFNDLLSGSAGKSGGGSGGSSGPGAPGIVPGVPTCGLFGLPCVGGPQGPVSGIPYFPLGYPSPQQPGELVPVGPVMGAGARTVSYAA